MADVQNDQSDSFPTDAALPPDLISLDETLAPTGESANSQDSILNAAQVFEAQLEQMTAWKHQLAQQMEVLRRDGVRVLERQKALAFERKKLADDRAQVVADRQYVQKLHRDLQTETEQITERQAQLELAQAALETTAQALNQREAELKAGENNLQEQQNRVLTQDVQLKSALEQLEAQRLQLCEAQRNLQREGESLAARRTELDACAAQVEALEKSAAAQSSELASREQQIQIDQKNLEEAQARLRTEQDQLRAAVEEFAASKSRDEQARGDMQQERDALVQQRRELQKRVETLEHEHADQLESLAKQSRRLLERRAELDARAAEIDKQAEVRLAAAPTENLSQSESNSAELEQLRTDLAQAAAAASEWTTREAQLRTELQTTAEQLSALQQDLARTSAELGSARQLVTDSNTAHGQELTALHNQLLLLEQQRNDLLEQVQNAQATLRRQNEDATIAQNAISAKLAALEEINRTLEAEKSAWQTQPSLPTTAPAQPARTASLEPRRTRLIHQARTVRTHRKQLRENNKTLDQQRNDIAQQREQLRMRKDNLEQVKRLLEKQEMVMARKLADHNALKTVAAVGIFVIMILGSVFFGVYRFVSPTYRAEAIVQLAPPQPLQGAELQAWMNSQGVFVRNNEVTAAAWKILRTPREPYSMQDTREDWLASLAKNLVVQTDPGTRTLSIQYVGNNPDGVASAANALAAAFAAPTARESTPDTLSFGANANVIAHAGVPQAPIQDSRLMISLSGVAMALFASLILVILFRHYVARQLREIDDMADEKDLEDIGGDLPPEASPL